MIPPVAVGGLHPRARHGPRIATLEEQMSQFDPVVVNRAVGQTLTLDLRCAGHSTQTRRG
jgi:hypothetical protein